MDLTIAGLLTKILTIVTSLLATVGTLQADVNALKAEQPSGNFGAVPVLTNPLTVDGLKLYEIRQTMRTSTTTVCAIKSPAATSTLRHAMVYFGVSSTTASIVTIAKSSTAYATTTQIGSNFAIAANYGATIVASSTEGLAGQAELFAPNQYLVVGMAGGVGNFSPVGNCQAEFQSVN